MIVTELYKGQGLGNQLACYVTTRVIALDKGYKFGIKNPQNFKGLEFLDIDFGEKVLGGKGPEGGPPTELPEGIKHYYTERKIFHPNGSDISIYDNDLVNVLDDTKIDGLMQGEEYIEHRKEEIKKWLEIKKEYECYEYADENTCVINFRGGEYARHPEFFLEKSYWDNAISHMRKINPNFRFIVITDDTLTAKKFFPDFGVFHFSIGKDYSIIKNAHYLILSNSTFAFFPAWLSDNLKYAIAPKYFARHNISDGYWSLGVNITKGFTYQDREGKLFTYAECMSEFEEYKKNNKELYPDLKIKENFLVISNYQNDIRWVAEYTDNYLIYNKDPNQEIPKNIDKNKIIQSPNIGYNIYDYFTFIIDNYENLPLNTIFTKGNIFPRHVSKDFFAKIMNNKYFTPIEDYSNHKPKFPIAFFSSDGGYCELNTSWYLKHWKSKYFKSYNQFLDFVYKKHSKNIYIRFAPGGNYIVPRENILKVPKIVYENLRELVSYTQLPGEAHILERFLYTLWNSNFEFREEILKPINLKLINSKKSYHSLSSFLKRNTPKPIKNITKSLLLKFRNLLSKLI